MTRFRLALSLILSLVVLAVVAVHRGHATAAEPSGAVPARSFAFTYQVHVPANADSGGPTHLWIPLPQADGYQDIRGLRVGSAASHVWGHDPEYGNAFAAFTPTMQQSAAGFDVVLRFTAVRREHRVVLDAAALQNGAALAPRDPDLQRYLEPDKLVPLNGPIAELAREHTAGDTTPIQKARHIYDYVLATMRYDKSGEDWGRGDALWACTSKRGNCTDFHSLFIGMMRSSGIPARFEIGFPLPENKTEGDIAGYHCWAEFYLSSVGWVPVDASEAWKNPAKRDFFFGAHDANRVFFTYGRDIRLSPDQKSEPLNYFIYPYAEANGQPVKNLQTHFSFREISSAQFTAAGR
ncbi:MAG TPA: transglutaminase-like domain-containing protein [Candidatus Elarobacter sp.]|nr:transglutaminase-like domain-containing protein [Candidatus Elarobacter sp.]